MAKTTFPTAAEAGVAGDIRQIMLDVEGEGLFIYSKPDRVNFGFYFNEWNNWPECGGFLHQPEYVLYLDGSEDSAKAYALLRRLHGRSTYAIRGIPWEHGEIFLIHNAYNVCITGLAAMTWFMKMMARPNREILKVYQANPTSPWPRREPTPTEKKEWRLRRQIVRTLGEYNFLRIQNSPRYQNRGPV